MVACSVQIWKNTFFKIVETLIAVFIKYSIIYMYLPLNYKTRIILSLSKTITLNFTMYILTILIRSFKNKLK